MPAFEVSPGPVENHRYREKGVLVYPVYSRRSGGLSVGINLFPDRKSCSFDCPYCEVFPFSSNTAFSLEQMKDDLCLAIDHTLKQNIPVRDICFSGNGEPSLSADFPAALEAALNIRGRLVPDAEVVVITNGAGLLDTLVFDLLREAAAGPHALAIWLKLDAGTAGWYQKINRSGLHFEKLVEKIREFTVRAPVIIQTMLCAVDGEAPPAEEREAWERLITELAANSSPACIRKIQIYGKARPAPEDPKASVLPQEYLEDRAVSLRLALGENSAVPVEVYP